MKFLGSPLEALREAARLRRKEGYRPGSWKNLLSCQTLFIQFALVYKVDLQTLDDFGAFAELLLILRHQGLIKLVAICDTDPSLVPLRVAFVFGFLGYLRISNLAPPKAQSFDPARHSSWADVRPCKQGILFDLKWTKTLKTQRGVTTIPLAALEDNRICPAATWTLYRHMLPCFTPDRTTPLLLTTAPLVGKTCLNPQSLVPQGSTSSGFVRQALYPPQPSARGASFCFQAGVPLDHIKKHGTGASQAVDRYLLQHQAFQTQVAQAFRQALTNPQQ